MGSWRSPLPLIPVASLTRTLGGIWEALSSMPSESDASADRCAVIEPIGMHDMRTALTHFSVPAQDETMAQLGDRARDRSFQGPSDGRDEEPAPKPRAPNLL